MYWVALITPFVAQIEYLKDKLILIFLWSSCTLVEAVDEFIEINEFSSWYFHKLVPKTESPQTWHLTKMMEALLIDSIFNTSRLDAQEELENQNYLLSAKAI